MKLNKLIDFVNKYCVNHQIFFTKNICNDDREEVFKDDNIVILKQLSYGTDYVERPTQKQMMWNELAIKINNGCKVKDKDAYFEILNLDEKSQKYIEKYLDDSLSILRKKIDKIKEYEYE